MKAITNRIYDLLICKSKFVWYVTSIITLFIILVSWRIAIGKPLDRSLKQLKKDIELAHTELSKIEKLKSKNQSDLTKHLKSEFTNKYLQKDAANFIFKLSKLMEKSQARIRNVGIEKSKDKLNYSSTKINLEFDLSFDGLNSFFSQLQAHQEWSLRLDSCNLKKNNNIIDCKIVLKHFRVANV